MNSFFERMNTATGLIIVQKLFHYEIHCFPDGMFFVQSQRRQKLQLGAVTRIRFEIMN